MSAPRKESFSDLLLNALEEILPVQAELPFPLCQISQFGDGVRSAQRYPHSLAILGPPGTGKSTLAVQLAVLAARQTGQEAAVIGVEQPGADLRQLALTFGWETRGEDRPGTVAYFTLQDREGHMAGLNVDPREAVAGAEEGHPPGGKPLPELVAGFRIVVLDGISGLLPSHDRQNWVAFLRHCSATRTFVILVGDEPEHAHSELEYLVDGVFRLNSAGAWRSLTIPKMRYMRIAHPGPHPVVLRPKSDDGCEGGVELTPSPYTLVEAAPRAVVGRVAEDDAGARRFGMEGFERLFGDPAEARLRPGETVLVAGNPGTGKTILMLQFLDATGGAPTPAPSAAPTTAGSSNRSLLVCIDRDFDSVRIAGRRLTTLAPLVDRFFDETPLRALNFATAACPPDYIVSRVLQQMDRLASSDQPVLRVGIVGLEALLDVIESVPERRRLMGAFLAALRNRRAISLFAYDVPGWFTRVGDMPSHLFELFDTVLLTGMREEMNRALVSLHAARSRGRALGGALVRLEVDRTGARLDFTAWSMAGLLSGDPTAVSDPRIFLKLFYENPSEIFVNKLYLMKLEERYPQAGRFSVVYKELPAPDHFSFRGYGGASHSNIKVLLLRKGVLDVMANEGRLQPLEELFPEHFRAKLDQSTGPIWDRLRGRHWTIMPCYLDVAMLFGRGKRVAEPQWQPESWEQVIELGREFARSRTKDDPPFWLTLPSLTGSNRGALVALLLSLTEAAGGALAREPTGGRGDDGGPVWEGAKRARTMTAALDSAIKSRPALAEALGFLFNLVDPPLEGRRRSDVKLIPNPFEGPLAADSVLSWSWMTAVEPYSVDEEKFTGLDKLPHYRFREIALARAKVESAHQALGSLRWKQRDLAQVGELYGLAVLRGALAPETAWYLIYDLLQPPAPDFRVAFRRGWPVRPEHFLGEYRASKTHDRDGKLYTDFVSHLTPSLNAHHHLMSDYVAAFDLEIALLEGLTALFSARRQGSLVHQAVDDAVTAIARKLGGMGEEALNHD